ncbi:MAG: hypothetical protein KAJ10_10230 [Thermodesulfovibrionia bacterium]|nr:hypothetical protein [Thermodesulfovibrionia bacterium]
MRVCISCGTTDNIIKFRKNRNQCVPCYNAGRLEYAEKYYLENKEKHMAWTTARREDPKYRKRVNESERKRYCKRKGWGYA